jgi:predicted dehydrogenase
MNPIPRRNFLAGTAATAALASLGSRAQETATAPTLKLGLIGCGWWGMVVANAALKSGGVEIISLCDVDSEHLAKASGEIAKHQSNAPRTFKLYPELLDTAGLDAVIIATPPQWHALPFIAACERGLAVYCEKPLAYDIREGQAMIAAANKHKSLVQIGFQRRKARGFVEARQYIQAGKAGRIISAEAQIHFDANPGDATPTDPPASLDWDLWCGPAPLIPYSKSVGHGSWRLENTTGHGHLVDWGIHHIDTARWILGAGSLLSVQSAGGLHHLKGRITTPDILTAHFEFDTCPLTWRHRIWGARDIDPATANGLFFYGEKETIFCADDRWIIYPRGRDAEPIIHRGGNDSVGEHIGEFLTALRQRTAASVDTTEGHLSTTAVKLAMISLETGSKISWNQETGEITAPDAARALLKRDYRAPWQHPHQA